VIVRFRLWISVATAAAFAFAQPGLFAQQNDQAALTGRVSDAGGGALAGVHVTVHAVTGSYTASVLTEPDGQFSLSGLIPGSYKVTVTHPGFASQTEQVTLSAGARQTLTFALGTSGVTLNVTVTAATSVTADPTGQTITSVDQQAFKNSANNDISQAMALVPGVTTISGNGPRDVFISVRGSNNTSAFGIRNLQIFDDGFPVTQPDGLSRADLIDPHAYGSIDVVQGPSSTLYGNFATGGAIFFNTRSGADVHGVELGAEEGSFGYLNDYLTAGGSGTNYRYFAFLSNERARENTENSASNTFTANMLGQFSITPRDRITLKFIDNDLDTELPIRLSLNQYRTNPYQYGCQVYNAANPNGCANVSLFVNGFAGTKQSVSAVQAGLGRNDRRTIFGARWEHQFTANTTWRTQFVFDDKDIDQPTGTTSARGSSPSFNVFSDGTRGGTLFGRPSFTYGGGFFDFENLNSLTYNLTPAGHTTLGGLSQTTYGYVMDAGLRGTEQWNLTRRWIAIAGLAGQYTRISANDTIYDYSTTATPATQRIPALRTYTDFSPEAALLYQPTANLQLHARLGAGFGTPQSSNLFVTPQGIFGDNTQLNAQKNIGIDLGADWSLANNLQVNVAGFYEHFIDELVTQSAGANLQSYTYNAPSAAHRGMVAGVDWHLLPQSVRGLSLFTAYTLDTQIYRRYTETLSSGAFSTSFDRAGSSVPGVVPNNLTARLSDDQTSRRFGAFGGYFETTWRDAYWLDNANLLQAPSATLMNADIHYDPPTGHSEWSRLHFYFDLQNLANRTYVGSANNITDSISSTTGLENGPATVASTTGSFYAGMPHASYGGVQLRF
jgi:iron complex outermembrane recepter protein